MKTTVVLGKQKKPPSWKSNQRHSRAEEGGAMLQKEKPRPISYWPIAQSKKNYQLLPYNKTR